MKRQAPHFEWCEAIFEKVSVQIFKSAFESACNMAARRMYRDVAHMYSPAVSCGCRYVHMDFIELLQIKLGNITLLEV